LGIDLQKKGPGIAAYSIGNNKGFVYGRLNFFTFNSAVTLGFYPKINAEQWKPYLKCTRWRTTMKMPPHHRERKPFLTKKVFNKNSRLIKTGVAVIIGGYYAPAYSALS
jgi:hypothetical protein